jgi:hypothetical protein
MAKRLLFSTTILSFVLISCFAPTENKSANGQNLDNKKKEEKCIDRIISEDSKAGTTRNHRCEEVSLSDAIKEYIQQLEKVDFSDCPAEFGNSFKAHIEAWRSTLIITDKHSEMRGEMHNLFDKINVSEDSIQFKKLVKGIWDTWADVEVAMKNGGSQ